MFCPKCAAQNLDGASFCRVCGSNISLVSTALSGQLPQAQPEESIEGRGRRRRGRGEPGIDSAVRSVFMGLAFLFVSLALAYSRMGTGWWFWMLIPAFSMMGTGVAQYIRFKEREKKSLTPPAFRQPSFQPQPRSEASLRAPGTGELISPPPSVTEGTTRHLGAEAPTRHLDEQ
ncbi:MAG TPA: zinc ribbon domain-containing protein [Pyrinomonadaceae bacterium]|nr:zinc ribbon domain-containing protein [Pyrinomonadaceae bacterium]